ncbi:MAG: Ig-like domain-containing protein, partial [Melioribacteraceae bacterium]|nr:Ig-like domain-containing protein [Melioribacteraceae bacterium]
APGQYKVYMEAEDYAIDSATVTVTAHQSVFADKFMNLIPNPNVPNILGNSPEAGSTEVSNLVNIEIDFDIRMDESSAESAFSIMPSVAGEFSWEDNHKKLIFNPDNPLSAGVNYTVSLEGSAKTYFGVPLGTPHAFSFSTRAKLNMESVYPEDNSIDISQTVQVRIQFDAPINSSTLPGNILFLDESGTFVQLAVDQDAYSKGWIIFETTNPLELNSSYRLILKEGIGDNEGVSFQEEIEINFRTVNSVYEGGNVIENFEAIGDWGNPSNDPGSIGIDSNATTFVISSMKKISGDNSGYLTYTFTQNDARVMLSSSNPKSIGTDPNSQFGVWIFGDLSGNLLELWFIDEQSNKAGVGYGLIDWTGWKMINIKLSDIVLSGNDKKFEGIRIMYDAFSGDSTGGIFIDDAQYDFTTPVENEIEILPNEYVLDQNYPNPF